MITIFCTDGHMRDFKPGLRVRMPDGREGVIDVASQPMKIRCSDGVYRVDAREARPCLPLDPKPDQGPKVYVLTRIQGRPLPRAVVVAACGAIALVGSWVFHWALG